MLSVNISAYKGDIPRNHVLVRCLNSALTYPSWLICVLCRTSSKGIGLICQWALNMTSQTGRKLVSSLVILSHRPVWGWKKRYRIWSYHLTEASKSFLYRLRRASRPTLTYFLLHSRLSILLPAKWQFSSAHVSHSWHVLSSLIAIYAEWS